MAGALPFPRLEGRGLVDDELELGQVVGTFGVRGEVKLFLHNRTSALFDGKHDLVLVHPDDGSRWRVRVTARPGAGKRILGRIDGLTVREVADTLHGATLAAARDDLPSLDDDEFYVWQLVGAEVRVDGQRVGEVTDVQQAGGMDVLVFRAGRGVHLVPCVKELVELDLDAGVVHVDASVIDDGDDR